MANHANKGYSLYELSVVLLIISVVIGMSFSAGMTIYKREQINASVGSLNTAKDALLLYRQKKGKFPCPALLTDAESSATYGKEVVGGCEATCPVGLTCSGNAVIGAVPFNTLGINPFAAMDAWEGKLTYVVDKNSTLLGGSDFGSLIILDSAGNEITGSDELGDALFVLISHGKDGKGAYKKNGTLTACSATALDAENCDNDALFRDVHMVDSDVDANNFDDLVIWYSQDDLSPPE